MGRCGPESDRGDKLPGPTPNSHDWHVGIGNWEWGGTSKDELDADLSLSAGVEEILHPVARVVGVASFQRRQDQRVVVVACREVDVREVDRIGSARRASRRGSFVQEIEDVRRGLLVE